MLELIQSHPCRLGRVRHTRNAVMATTTPTTAKTIYAVKSSPGVSALSAAPLRSAVGLRLIAGVVATWRTAPAGRLPGKPDSGRAAHTNNNIMPSQRLLAFVIAPILAAPVSSRLFPARTH